jgi:hypothetical protein
VGNRFFSFRLEQGKVNSIYSTTNDKGEVIKYPDFDKFDEKTYGYLNERLNRTSNPLLKARYSHILWGSPQKHAKYAKIAIEAYLELIHIYEEKDQKEHQEHYGFEIIDIIHNAYVLGYQVRYNVEHIKAELIRLVTTFNMNGVCSFLLILILSVGK